MTTDEIPTPTHLLTAYVLAEMAGCSTPDSPESPGADYLCLVRDSVVEAYTFDATQDPGDVCHELADSSVPVYTYPLWRTFADLGAWVELDDDQDGLGIPEAAAAALVAHESYRVPSLALYSIGRRLAEALWARLSEAA